MNSYNKYIYLCVFITICIIMVAAKHNVQQKDNVLKENTSPAKRNIIINVSTPHKSVTNVREQAKLIIMAHEGYREKVYTDTLGHKTIGIGFLVTPDIQKYMSGNKMSNENIMLLFNRYIAIAYNDANKYINKDNKNYFDKLHPNAQIVLIDMAYNLGYSRLSKFKKLQQALIKLDYQKAAKEMKNSLWFEQVGNRSIELYNLMRNIK